MRFLIIWATLSLPVNVLAAPTCATSGAGTFMNSDADWYRAITYVAAKNTFTTPDVPSTIIGYFNTLAATSANDEPVAAMATGLGAAFNFGTRAGIPTDCFKCAFDFAVAAYAAFANGLPGAALKGNCQSDPLGDGIKYYNESGRKAEHVNWGCTMPSRHSTHVQTMDSILSPRLLLVDAQRKSLQISRLRLIPSVRLPSAHTATRLLHQLVRLQTVSVLILLQQKPRWVAKFVLTI